ncbi:hypothetical protein [Variovorax paradoxus]|uniref:hypothetical protein n=1 Tax=Variovorax paradoxus TaxID=34073 RepID=UPI003D647BF3
MILALGVFLTLIAVASVLTIGEISRIKQRNSYFHEANIGSDYSLVIARLGKPTFIEPRSASDKSYDWGMKSSCNGECSVRIGYRTSVFLDLKLVIFDFNDQNKLIYKSRQVSP